MKSSIRVKFIKKFRNPTTNRMTEIGAEQNVLQDIFWLKRIKEKDCEQIKRKAAQAPAPAAPKSKLEPKKGSK